MKTLKLLSLGFLLALLLTGSGTFVQVAHSAENSPAARSRIPAHFVGRVMRVVDGDTLQVRYRNLLVNVDLYAVDAPELKQPFGKNAREYVEAVCLGKSVTVDGQRVVGDSLLAIVRVNGKGILNELLLNEGIAWFDAFHGRSARLPKLEANARRAKRGLWSTRNPIAPWIWRQKQREKVDKPSKIAA